MKNNIQQQNKFKIKKENTICSLKEVESFLQEITGASKSIKLFNILKNIRKN